MALLEEFFCDKCQKGFTLNEGDLRIAVNKYRKESGAKDYNKPLVSIMLCPKCKGHVRRPFYFEIRCKKGEDKSKIGHLTVSFPRCYAGTISESKLNKEGRRQMLPRAKAKDKSWVITKCPKCGGNAKIRWEDISMMRY